MPKQRFYSIANISIPNESLSESNSLDSTIKATASFDFSNIKNKTLSYILRKIPTNAIKRTLIPTGSISEGFEYTFSDGTYTWKVRFHGPDSSAPENSNAYNGWIVRVRRGRTYMDSAGNFHGPGIFNTNSPLYNEDLCDDTHIPIKNDLER